MMDIMRAVRVEIDLDTTSTCIDPWPDDGLTRNIQYIHIRVINLYKTSLGLASSPNISRGLFSNLLILAATYWSRTNLRHFT